MAAADGFVLSTSLLRVSPFLCVADTASQVLALQLPCPSGCFGCICSINGLSYVNLPLIPGSYANRLNLNPVNPIPNSIKTLVPSTTFICSLPFSIDGCPCARLARSAIALCVTGALRQACVMCRCSSDTGIVC